MKKWFGISATLLFLAACNSAPPAPQPAPVTTPLVLDSFAATPNPAPLNVGTLFNWTILGGNGKVTCELDVNSDGTIDYSLESCTSATKQSYFYITPGTYSAKLKVTDQSGVSQEKSTTVTVLPVNKGPQIMRFEAEKGKTDLTARILFTVFDKEGDIVTCRLDTTNDGEWDYEFTPCRPNAFSKGVTITPSNTGGVVEVTYPAKGSYTAKLEAFDAYGEDRAVLPLELPYITLPPPGACEVTNLSNSAVGSLRYWVESGRCRVVTFAAGLQGSIWLQERHIEVYQSITIIGPGSDRISVYGGDEIRHFRIFGGDVSISGLTLRDGRRRRGGSIRTEGDSLTLNNMVFKNNRADAPGEDRGGAIFHDGSGTLTIANSRFDNNYSETEGGAIYSTNSADDVEISNTVFTSNGANGDGGAIFMVSDNLILNSTDFTQNNSNNYGGAVYMHNGALDMMGGVVGGNYTYGDGTFYLDQVPTSISRARFQNNLTDDDGAGIFKRGSGNLDLDACTFMGNEVAESGAAIFQEDSGDLYVDRSVFVNNVAGDYGGAIYRRNNGSANITNSRFSNNQATDIDGGAIQQEGGGSLSVQNSQFESNQAGDDGGAIQRQGDGNLVVSESVFQNNQANADGGSSGSGGAIYKQGLGSISIQDSSFTGNQTDYDGGAIYKENESPFTVANSTFTNNVADADTNDTGDGGAIYRRSAGSFNINGSTFTNNQAYNGGAIYRTGGDTLNLPAGNLISSNTARNRGGGIFNNSGTLQLPAIEYTGPAIITLNQCLGGANCGGGIRNGGTINGDLDAVTLNTPTDISP